MKTIFQRSLDNSELIVQKFGKKKNLYYLMSLGLSILIFLTPILILSNLFIYIDSIFLVTATVAVTLYLTFVLADVIYCYILSVNDEEIHFKQLLPNLILSGIAYLIVFIVLYLVTFIILGVFFLW